MRIDKYYPPLYVHYTMVAWYGFMRHEEQDSISYANYKRLYNGHILIEEYYANAEDALMAAADAFREAICSESGKPDIYDIRNFLRDSFLGATHWVQNIPF